MRKSVIAAVVATFATAGLILSQSSQNPHGKLKWDCQDCHTSESWTDLRSPMNFDHDQTGFHLAGAHALAQCIGCHKTSQFSHVGTACIDCHADQHQGQLGQTCDNCHTVRDWQSRKNLLELHAQKGFALTGVHAVADCESCHRNHSKQEYAGTPMDCIGCHSEAFAATTNPSHAGAGFSNECERCHHAASGTWSNASYIHKTFQLTGAHRTIECGSCHVSGYDGTSADCYSCHKTDFTGTTEPNHVQSGFDHNCAVCHSTSFFRPAQYNHNLTAFPLTGKHLTTLCADCHTTGYAGTPTDCWSCHQTAFTNAPDPNHVLANFDHNCTSCHTTAGWTPSSFSHNATAFPLLGAHTTVACIACHATGYTNTPTTCVSCHQSDYDGTTDPVHSAANFPNSCQTCHGTTAWSPSTWNHDALYFPINSGAHSSVWSSCATCHTVPTNFAVFECINCHQHEPTTTNAKHSQVNNYQYLSTACYSCHPRGVH